MAGLSSYSPMYKTKQYTSFGGTDITASITLPNSRPLVFGELQTISYSIHREKFPVRTLGRINPVGFSAGGRTISGSLIFTVFDRHAIIQALNNFSASDVSTRDVWGMSKYDVPMSVRDMMEYGVTDELPPFDVTVNLGNEYGQRSVVRIFGITIIDEGQVMSIEDILTENTMTYMATDIQTMRPKGGWR